jgi:hypothetical protein
MSLALGSLLQTGDYPDEHGPPNLKDAMACGNPVAGACIGRFAGGILGNVPNELATMDHS